MVFDLKKLKRPYRARVVLWPGRRGKLILRTPVDELGAKLTVATDIEVKEMFFELGDIVNLNGGRDPVSSFQIGSFCHVTVKVVLLNPKEIQLSNHFESHIF